MQNAQNFDLLSTATRWRRRRLCWRNAALYSLLTGGSEKGGSMWLTKIDLRRILQWSLWYTWTRSTVKFDSFWPLATLRWFFRNQSYWQSCRARLDGSTEYHIGGEVCDSWLTAKISSTGNCLKRIMVASVSSYDEVDEFISPLGGGQLPRNSRFPDGGFFDRLSGLAKTNRLSYISR